MLKQPEIDPITGLDCDDLNPPDYRRWCYKGGSPSPPPPPDPAATAAAQAAANKETAIASQELALINQRTPFGSLDFEQTGVTESGTPQFTATQVLAPEQQRQLDLTNQAGIAFGETANEQLANVRDTLSQPIDFSGLGPAPVANEVTRQAVRDSILARLQPDIERDREALTANLANQGITPGSQAFDNAFRPFNQSLTDARLAADAQAGVEQSRLFGLESAARNAAINEQNLQRSIPLNELAALLSGTQVQSPQFITPPNTPIANTDVLGATFAANNAAQTNFLAEQQRQNALTGGLFGLGSAALLGGLSPGGFLR